VGSQNRSSHAAAEKTLHGPPMADELLQMIKEADATPNKEVAVSWPNSKQFTLTVIIATANQGMIKRSTDVKLDPQWTLTKNTESGVPKAVLWKHTARDPDLIVQLMEMAQGNSGKFQAISDTSEGLPGAKQTILSAPTEMPAVSGFAPPTQPLDFSVVAANQAPAQAPSTQLQLSGDLKNVEISNVLQTINMLNMTGKLALEHQDALVELFFKDGSLCHAVIQKAFETEETTQMTPVDIVFDILMWNEGSFRFFPGWTTKDVTISKRLETLLLEGATVADYHAALKNMGFTTECLLRRGHEYDEEELDKALKGGVPVDVNVQKELYYRVVAPVPSSDLIKGMSRATYIPVIYNLLHLGLLSIAETSASSAETSKIRFDTEFAEYGRRSLLRPDSNMMTFPIFLHFLQQEAARAVKHKEPLALLLLTGKNKDMVNDHYTHLGETFGALSREYDLIAHFEMQDLGTIAMLLPYRNTSGAYVFADRFQTILKAKGVKEEFRIGVASLPQSASDLDTLLRIAGIELDRAFRKNIPICTNEQLELSNWSELLKAGQTALRSNDMPKAMTHFKECLAEASKFARDDERLIVTFDTMAQIYMKGGQSKLALQALQAVLKLKEECSVQDEIANCVALMGRCHFELGEYPQSEAALLRAISSFTRIYGPQHITVGNVYHNLATLYHLTNRIEDAKTSYHKAISIKRKLLRRNHPELQKLLKNYSEILKVEQDSGAEVGAISGTWKAIEVTPMGAKPEAT